MKTLIFISAVLFSGCYVSKNPLRHQSILLRKGYIKEDSSYVYALPFEKGKSVRVIQGYFSHFSHKERAALDFNLKRGSKILAAREGIVIRVKEDGQLGGLNKKFRPQGNNMVIQHLDGSRAGYWHLQYNGATVNVGDTIQRGQMIGFSGKTGYAVVPHLHFLVWRNDNNSWQQVLTRFETSEGVEYLKFWKKYRSKR